VIFCCGVPVGSRAGARPARTITLNLGVCVFRSDVWFFCCGVPIGGRAGARSALTIALNLGWCVFRRDVW